MGNTIFKNDKYKQSRGGYSRLLDIECGACFHHIFYYQKDGPGILKRMYIDRIIGSEQYSGLENIPLIKIPPLLCPECHVLIGVPYLYEKEKRLAFRLFVGAILKKIIKI
ncbi:hypothetical protein HGA88_05320 [Candidatus Roizmanbacteria bacterium]|nr:hypothetical protein [Candidatus Roizmanbacteria bacterium]